MLVNVTSEVIGVQRYIWVVNKEMITLVATKELKRF